MLNNVTTPSIKLNSGYSMPLVGFGTSQIVGQDSLDLVVDSALGAGYRLFDTARFYDNETELGNAFEKFLPKYGLTRGDIFVTTKFIPQPDNNLELMPKFLEESLTNLKTSYIDLVLIHYPKSPKLDNEDTRNRIHRKEIWTWLESVPDTIIHSIGVSNYEISHLEEISGFSTKVPDVNQLEFHPHFRRTSLKEYCQKKGIHFQAFSSFGRSQAELFNDEAVVQLAKKYHTSAQTILLSFATSQNIGVIPKSSNPERIVENFNCFNLNLSKEDLDLLNSIQVETHYRPLMTPWLVK
ncbi:aldo/keto reductase family domain-containing protein [Ditylenchus destructor]|uniref:Aldo/keto reductase family domain-containing protein n=1 Tax=Ditylenchus destructor TaxID=166010 RepID=A0AAD4MKD6_9BILA|nr:aldo/keto reductase family domain-containing protein [Ditylenchus destructor]